ncbi:MAG: hypothetical protein ABS78_23055 [Phenylobacterium sp. SCN 70-31]|nr:MAG: hypothetical protein ABS78_23055 [Phenylobacterium sp. SCN 70-31]
MEKTAFAALAALALAGCQPAGGDSTKPGGAAPTADARSPGPVPSAGGATPSGQAVRADLSSRTGELVNPSEEQMLFLYHDLAGVNLSKSDWVEQSMQVRIAAPHEKAAKREAAGKEFDALQASVGNVGRLRFSISNVDARFDPTYSEYLLRAFSPSSALSFRSAGETVQLKFGNGQTAQIWKVPPAEAQAISDRIGSVSALSADILVQIADVQPGTQGGAIVANILEYELTSRQTGLVVTRGKPGG